MTLQNPSFGKLLRHYRDCLDWTQELAANKLGIAPRTYQDWEEERRIPNSTNCEKIVNIFQLNEEQANALRRAANQIGPEVHNLPFPQNLYFTGREAYLEQLDQYLRKNGSVAITQPISISGLGGIGKTQLALEYAHRCYSKVYRTILWTNAANKTTLEESYLSLARLLKLPEKEEREADRIIQAVRAWLEGHTSWLLILDNVDDFQLIRAYLPVTPRGHILLTTRSQIVGNVAFPIIIESMETEEGLHFLLRRSGMLKYRTEAEIVAPGTHEAAMQLVELLGRHPLALDQAGAYLEETRDFASEVTGSSFIEYIHLYHEQRRMLLDRRGGFLGGEHPETVFVTFEISFKKACELYPKCADLMYACSFLEPDTIPEELFTQGNDLQLDPLVFNEAVKALRSYSLIKRNAENRILSVHRLVQAVLQDKLDQQTYQEWIERIVRAIEVSLPSVDHTTWLQYERYLPHAQICALLIEKQQMTFVEAARLVDKIGRYLHERGRYTDAEPVALQHLRLHEQTFGSLHPSLAASMNNLASLYVDQGKFAEAHSLYQRLIHLQETTLGSAHPDLASSLTNLARLYSNQGKDAEAEFLYQRALLIWEKASWPQTPHIATCLNNLAALYAQQGRYDQAEPLYQLSLYLREQMLGSEHPEVASSLTNLATLYSRQGKYEQAEPLFQKALHIWEHILDPEHPDIARLLINLGTLYAQQGKYGQAEPLYQHALLIFKKALGPEHPDLAHPLMNLAGLYKEQGRYAKAEPLFLQAFQIWERTRDLKHPDLAHSLTNLAELYKEEGKYEQAKLYYQRALLIWQQVLNPGHPRVAIALNKLAELYKEQRKYVEAISLYQQALHILEQVLSSDHQLLAYPLNGLANIYAEQGKYKQAELFYQQALTIREDRLGAQEPETAESLHDFATFQMAQGNRDKAVSLYQRALTIREQALGLNHPRTVETRRRYIALLGEMGRQDEAALLETPQSLFAQAEAEREKSIEE